MRLPLGLDARAATGLGLFGLTLGFYISSLPPSITWRNAAADSGDLAAAVQTLGVPHPPGYPTYVLLGRLFAFLPFGDTAYRLNLMSAITGAAAVALTFGASLLLLDLMAKRQVQAVSGLRAPVSAARLTQLATRLVSAGLAALTVAFAPIFWGQATVTEVYALNALFVALIACLLLSWLASTHPPPAQAGALRPIAAAFLLGLGMGNHFTLAIASVPLGAAVLWRIRPRARIPWASMALALALGLGVYGYLPVSASGDPPINWGDPADPSGFLWSVSAKPYRSFPFGLERSLWDDRVGDWGKQMVDQFQGVGVVLALAGAWRLWRWDRLLAGALVVSFLALSVYSAFYRTGDSFVFLLPVVLIGALALSAGAHWLLAELAAPTLGRLARPPAAGVVGAALVLALVGLIPGTSLARNYHDLDLSGDTEARDYARTVFATVEPNAVVLAETDRPVFSLWYHQFVVEKESRVAVVARNFLQFDWYVDALARREPGLVPHGLPVQDFALALKTFVAAQQAVGRPVYTTSRDVVLQEVYRLAPVGPIFKVEPPGAA